MCVRTHVLFNSYLMYVNHFNTFFIPEACSVTYTLLYMTYTLLYIERRFMLPHYIYGGGLGVPLDGVFGTHHRPERSYRYASSLIDTAMVLRRR